MIEPISDLNRDKTRDKLISKINELINAVNELRQCQEVGHEHY